MRILVTVAYIVLAVLCIAILGFKIALLLAVIGGCIGIISTTMET